MVQVPASFNPAQPCIVTATSSGSRGIYGAIGTAGEWGLKHGCAVAYTDKGSGNGMPLENTEVWARDHTYASGDLAAALKPEGLNVRNILLADVRKGAPARCLPASTKTFSRTSCAWRKRSAAA